MGAKTGTTDSGLAAADAYVDDVLAGRVVTGRLVRLAVERHVRDLDEGHHRGLTFRRDWAAHALDFFPRYLRHIEGRKFAGQPFVLSPFQAFRIGCVFGWARETEDGPVRRFNEAYHEEGRKNGKSIEAAGVGLYCFDFDGEEGAQVVTIATKKDQAKIIHGTAIAMVRKSPALSDRILIRANNLSNPLTNSKYFPLGKDSKTEDGWNPSCALIDEYHAHPDDSMHSVIRSGTGSRDSPLLWIVTTAGFNPNSACYERRSYCVRVLEGLVEDDALFAFIAALDRDPKTDELLDDWKDESCWVKPNPNLGVSKRLDYMRAMFKRALEMLTERENFQVKDLNIWQRTARRWVATEVWKRNAVAVDEQALEGRRGYCGLDLSTNKDLTAFVLVFPMDDGSYKVVCRCWVPQETAAQQAKAGTGLYLQWAKEGFLKLVPGRTIDYAMVRAEIADLRRRFSFQKGGYDPWNAGETAKQLEQDGLDLDRVTQGRSSFAAVTKWTDTLLEQGRLHHGGHPVLAYCMGNVDLDRDAFENYWPTKANATGRIDLVMAMLMALRSAMANPKHRSVYSTRGMIRL